MGASSSVMSPPWLRATSRAMVMPSPTPPVVGLREGTMLRREGARLSLLGVTGARIFRRGERPVEVPPGADLGELLR